MSLHRGADGADPVGSGPVARLAGAEDQRLARSAVMCAGTLACPHCDAPVVPGVPRVAPADQLFCPYCGHDGAVRDFLSLAPPTRPTRVKVRVVNLTRWTSRPSPSG